MLQKYTIRDLLQDEELTENGDIGRTVMVGIESTANRAASGRPRAW